MPHNTPPPHPPSARRVFTLSPGFSHNFSSFCFVFRSWSVLPSLVWFDQSVKSGEVLLPKVRQDFNKLWILSVVKVKWKWLRQATDEQTQLKGSYSDIVLQVFTIHGQFIHIRNFDDINNEAIALFMFRYFNNNLPSSFNGFFCLNKHVHYYNKRSSINVHKTADKIQARTNYQKHSIKCKGVSIWNNWPKSIKEIKAFNLLRKKI